ncbi:MAG: GIY-YIG nuclease family protein [Candidatus Pacebacteria bacterium]|nr:GIY-YIG nuclease family protein [Candidatus Paceibacterota bacterium]
MKVLNTKTKDFLKKLPNAAGVYIFRDKAKKIIYIGRAASLRSRVSSYFRKNSLEYVRPAELFSSEIVFVSFTKTPTLLEAAILENNLIKKHRPKYNIKDKDDRSFVYVFFDMKTDYPKPIIIRGRELEKHSPKGVVIGPFRSQAFLKKILLSARRIFPYSTCRPNSGKPCFHYQIGLCLGVCVGEILPKEYKRNIRGLIRFLKSGVLSKKESGRKFDDTTLIPEEFIFSSKKSGVSRIEGYDISHLSGKGAYGAMIVFQNGVSKNSHYRLFKIRNKEKGSDIDALKEVLERRIKHREWQYPDLIVVDGGVAQVHLAARVLRLVGLKIPVVGLSKAGLHSASASRQDKLVFSAAIKKPVREMIISQKKLLQQVRNEAHRFSLRAQKKSRRI